MSQPSRTLLVTGGAGFIGANFILYWLKQHPEDTVINLDLLTYAGNLATLESIASQPNYKFIKGDICDATLVDRVMAGIDFVVHFAAESHVDRSIKDPDIFLNTNVMGTHTLLKAALKHQVKRFHHVSTDEVFGSLELGSKTKFMETTPYQPHSPYSASKAASDHLVRAYGDTYGLPFTISNCSNNYGEYQFPEKIIPLAVTNLTENRSVPVYGDGLNVRDWLYVQDHCRAIDLILTNGQNQHTYLIGGLTEDVSNLELVKMILRLMGKSEAQITFVTDRPGHDRRYAVDWSTIHAELGWSPTVSLEEGIHRTIDWYKANPGWWQPLKQKNQAYFETHYADRKL
jgi:dTDP-glucose 4,6-dehydratase